MTLPTVPTPPSTDRPQLHVVVGGQFGSEAKGHVTQDVCTRLSKNHPIVSVRVAGPNAGHIVYARNLWTGKTQKFPMRQIPVGFSIPRFNHTEHKLYIAPGSEVDPTVLEEELGWLREAGLDGWIERLYISPRATLLGNAHKHTEQMTGLNGRLGSTAKGIGAARVDRLNRLAKTVDESGNISELQSKYGFKIEDVDLPASLATHSVVIEGTQGYGLGLHTEYYPFTTSSDCRASDFLAMAGVSAWDVPENQFVVDMVIRPYPIRVAGNSGPLHEETTWGELDLPEEQTTVTKKTRRVGHYDKQLVLDAIQANGRSRVALHLSMADQVDPKLTDKEGITGLTGLIGREKIGTFISENLTEAIAAAGLGLVWIGTGPQTHVSVGTPRPYKYGALSNLGWDGPVGFVDPKGVVRIEDNSGAAQVLGNVTSVSVGTLQESTHEVTFQNVDAGLITQVAGVKITPATPTPWTEDTEIGKWLNAYIDREVGVMLQKAAEYGSVELIEAGRTLSSIMQIDDIPDSWAAENQIYQYVLGKLGRWTAAMRRGEQVSQDTVHDIFVYSLMVLKLRETGEWA